MHCLNESEVSLQLVSLLAGHSRLQLQAPSVHPPPLQSRSGHGGSLFHGSPITFTVTGSPGRSWFVATRGKSSSGRARSGLALSPARTAAAKVRQQTNKRSRF